jgi:hypothetical protein
MFRRISRTRAAHTGDCAERETGRLRLEAWITITPNLRPPMHEIYAQPLAVVKESVGVDYLPTKWIRGVQPRLNVQA